MDVRARESGHEPAGESFFHALVELMPQMVWTKDAHGRNDYCNSRFLEYMGLSADEFVNDSWIVAHPADVARGQAAWSAALETGSPYEAELRLRPKNAGAYRWFLVRAVPHRDASGRIDKWFGTTTDIDAQRRAFAALDFLAESGARLATAQDVDAVLDRLAHASLEGLADISLFDLEEEGEFRRLIVASESVPRALVELVRSFGAPGADDTHPIARAMRTASAIHLPNIDGSVIERTLEDPQRQAAWRTLDLRSLVSAPMIVPGRVRGALTLVRRGPSIPFGAAEVNVIEEVARRAAVAIDTIRRGDSAQRAARDLRAFADLGESITGSLGLAETLDAVMSVIVPARADWAFITLADDHGDLRLAAVDHPDDAASRSIAAHIGAPYWRDGASGATLEVLQTRGPVLRENMGYADAESIVNPPVLDALWNAGFTSFVVVPLFSGAKVRGTLHVCMSAAERTFARSDMEFFQEFARRLAPAIANAELFDRERRVARSFQEAALPAALPDVPGFAFHAIYEAGKAEALVGGDWYDVFALDDGRIVISIGDVAGSGLSAAVTMAAVRQAIRGAAHVLPDPSVMLASADRAINDPNHRFVTAFVGVIDPASAALTYRSAGHPPPLLLLQDGAVIDLECGGTPLGLQLDNGDAATYDQALPVDSLLVLYTDGLIEATHDILEGERRLRDVLRDGRTRGADNPAKIIHDLILAEGSRDDVAILTVDVLGVDGSP